MVWMFWLPVSRSQWRDRPRFPGTPAPVFLHTPRPPSWHTPAPPPATRVTPDQVRWRSAAPTSDDPQNGPAILSDVSHRLTTTSEEPQASSPHLRTLARGTGVWFFRTFAGLCRGGPCGAYRRDMIKACLNG